MSKSVYGYITKKIKDTITYELTPRWFCQTQILQFNSQALDLDLHASMTVRFKKSLLCIGQLLLSVRRCIILAQFLILTISVFVMPIKMKLFLCQWKTKGLKLLVQMKIIFSNIFLTKQLRAYNLQHSFSEFKYPLHTYKKQGFNTSHSQNTLCKRGRVHCAQSSTAILPK